uniref:Uncharacterized protein n=1 Tax=Spumella elongata TaxID=89044 RepID=A0A7S3HLH5_9STRA|mmetsp:Transcript_58270/g.102500  ORF Transcript_58270/g.102500 Transcript_58270/m.102500 type:complete len:365 (+) Transcript_58270:38-1132(+)
MQEAKVGKTDSAEEFFRALGDDDFFLLGEGEPLTDTFFDSLESGMIPEASIPIVSADSTHMASDVSVAGSEGSSFNDDISLQTITPVKTNRQRKRKAPTKKEPAVVGEAQNGMVPFEPMKTHRLTHSVLNDVRRHYARMFITCVNSSDLHSVDSFFSTFMSGPCHIVANHRLSSAYGLPMHLDATGPRQFAHYLMGCFVTFPDLMLKLNESKIITSTAWKGSKIVMDVEAHCTKIYDIPDYQWVPEVDKLSNMYTNLSVEDGQGEDNNSGDGESKGAVVPAAQPPTTIRADYFQRVPSATAIPQSYYESVVEHAHLVPVPQPLITKGIITLELDENHCMKSVTVDHWQQNNMVRVTSPRKPDSW